MSFDREAVRARRETAIAELNAIDYRNDAGLAEWVRTWTHIVCLDLPAALDEIERLRASIDPLRIFVEEGTGYLPDIWAGIKDALEGRE